MKGFKGKVSFYRNARLGFTTPHQHDDAVPPESALGSDFVYLGATLDVDVTFIDTRQLEIEAIEKQMENERAESQQRLNVMMGRIQQLQALEHD